MGPAAIVAGKLLAVLAKSCVWPVGQAVKTRPFHGCNMGSIPVRVTKQKTPAANVAGVFSIV